MSFSQEMKDFLGAYQSGQKINASRTDQDYKEQLTAEKKATNEDNADPESVTNQLQQTQLDRAKQLLAHSAAARGEQAQRHQLAMRQAATPPGSGLYPATGAITPGGTGPQPTPGGALPIGPSTLNDGTQEYAAGGLVPDEPEGDGPEEVEPQNVGAVPINPINQDPRLPEQPMPAGAPTDVSARRRGLSGVVAPELIHDATRAGMTYGAKEYGLMNTGAVMTPAQKARAQMFSQGHGGLTDQEMQAARQAVDPEGKLTDSQRNMAALGSVYQFWANKGDGDKAQRVAFQMLQHFRNASQRYAAIAAHAADGGNVDLATKAAMKAYANVPDGNDLSLEPNPDGGIMYHVTGPNGEDVVKGIATPQQLASSAMGLATGGFDKAILSAAGQREAATGGAVSAGKPQTATDRAKEAELPAAEIDKLKVADQKANEKTPELAKGDEFWSEAANTAQHLMQQNPHMNASEAARASHAMLLPNKVDPEKPVFKVKMGEEGQPNAVTLGKLKFNLDNDQLEAIQNSQAARIKSAVDKINADTEASDTPSRTEQALEGAKQVAKGVGGALEGGPGSLVTAPTRALAGKAMDALTAIYGQHIPQNIKDAVSGAGEAVGGAVSDAAGDVGDVFTNPAKYGRGAIPIDEGDRPL